MAIDMGVGSTAVVLSQTDIKNKKAVICEKPLCNIPVDLGRDGNIEDFIGGRDKSKASVRTELRASRRMKDRKKRRKSKVFNKAKQMLGGSFIDDNYNDFNNKGAIIEDLIKKNRPYYKKIGVPQQLTIAYLRYKGLSEKLNKEELMIILYSFAGNRGAKIVDLKLQNNEGEDGEDSEQVKDDKKTKAKIDATDKMLKKNKYRTLSEYLWKEYQSGSFNPKYDRIRGGEQIVLSRQHIIDEFHLIKETQLKYCSDMSREQWDDIEKEIFFQRPLKSQKQFVGCCSIFPVTDKFIYGGRNNKKIIKRVSNKRAKKCRYEAQVFLVLQQLNNLRIVFNNSNRELTLDEKKIVFDLLNNNDSITFEKIRKELGLDDKKGYRFNYEYINSTVKPQTNVINAKMLSICGQKWQSLSEKKKIKIIAEINACDREHGINAFKKRMSSKYGFSDNEIEQIMEYEFPSGYLNISLKAIRELYPLMKVGVGLSYSSARKIIIDKHKKSDSQKKQSDKNYIPPLNKINRVIANPVVKKQLSTVRQDINKLAKKHVVDTIIVERCKEGIDKSKKARKLLSNSKNQDRNNEIVNILNKYNIAVTNNNIKKFKLAYDFLITKQNIGQIVKFVPGLSLRKNEEFNFLDIYTLEIFGIKELYNTNKITKEHIHSQSIGGGSEFDNLCMVSEYFNSKKMNTFCPLSYFTSEELDRRINIMTELKIGKNKINNFKMSDAEYKNRYKNKRDLQNTAHMTSELETVVKDNFQDSQIIGCRNLCVSHLRRHFKIKKDRSNHLHHVEDAILLSFAQRRLLLLLGHHLSDNKISKLIERFYPCNIDFNGDGNFKKFNISSESKDRFEFGVALKEYVAQNIDLQYVSNRRIRGKMTNDTAVKYECPLKKGEDRVSEKKSVLTTSEKADTQIKDEYIRNKLLAAIEKYRNEYYIQCKIKYASTKALKEKKNQMKREAKEAGRKMTVKLSDIQLTDKEKEDVVKKVKLHYNGIKREDFDKEVKEFYNKYKQKRYAELKKYVLSKEPLTNRNGTVVRRVRVVKTSQGLVKLKNSYKVTNNNYCMSVYKNKKTNKHNSVVHTLHEIMDRKRRIKKGEKIQLIPIEQNNDKMEFVCNIYKGDYVSVLNSDNIKEKCYVKAIDKNAKTIKIGTLSRANFKNNTEYEMIVRQKNIVGYNKQEQMLLIDVGVGDTL